MRIGLGQAYYSDSGLNTSGIAVNPNPTIPAYFGNLDNLPLFSTAAIMPSVSAIPCPASQTCSYFANIPDWTLYAAGIVALIITAGFLRK